MPHRAARRARRSDRPAQLPPQLRLPLRRARQQAAGSVARLTTRPCLQRRGTPDRVALEQLRDALYAREPPLGRRVSCACRRERRCRCRARRRRGSRSGGRCLERFRARAPVGGQRREPRLQQAGVDDAEQRPQNRPGTPRIAVGVRARRGSDGRIDEGSGRGECDVGADAVAVSGPRAEAAREALRQPALHPARGYGHDLAGERVGGSERKDLRERIGQRVRSFGSVDSEHA